MQLTSGGVVVGGLLRVIQNSTRLLFRASRDGEKADDFYRCCVNQGPTLTLVHVLHSDTVFGLYAAAAWPKPPSDSYSKAPDPSGRSFVFSLVNQYKRPFRMSLKDKTRTLASSYHGPSFGAPTDRYDPMFGEACVQIIGYKGANLWHLGRSTGAYQLDPWPRGSRAPKNFDLREAFASMRDFTTAEILCFAMPAVAPP